MSRRRRKHVAIVMHRWVGYLHGVQLGIAKYVTQKPDWICTHFLPDPPGLETLSRHPVDGIIAYLEPHYVTNLQAPGVPVIDVSNWMTEQPFSRVIPDDQQIGELAADYLCDLGLKHFAFRGHPHAVFSHLRRQAFAARLKENGFTNHVWPTDVLPDPRFEPPSGVDPSILTWLIRLPKPVGIFCAHDLLACDMIDLCRHARLRVPEDVCVLGVDNDELLTQISHPPVSSITLQTEKIGFESARLLDRLMRRPTTHKQVILVPPGGVIARQSTNLLAIEDQTVLTALRYIREHIHERISVEDLMDVIPVNRRFLERRFREHLGRTPLQEIRRVRIETAKKLLSETDLAMPAIARRSGFANAERLSSVFHSMTGMTPTQYRRQFRLHDT